MVDKKPNGNNFLTKLAKDGKKIDYNNLFFEIDDKVPCMIY